MSRQISSASLAVAMLFGMALAGEISLPSMPEARKRDPDDVSERLEAAEAKRVKRAAKRAAIAKATQP